MNDLKHKCPRCSTKLVVDRDLCHRCGWTRPPIPWSVLIGMAGSTVTKFAIATSLGIGVYELMMWAMS